MMKKVKWTKNEVVNFDEEVVGFDGDNFFCLHCNDGFAMQYDGRGGCFDLKCSSCGQVAEIDRL